MSTEAIVMQMADAYHHTQFLIFPILSLPPCKICLSTQSPFGVSLKSSPDRLYFPRNKRCELCNKQLALQEGSRLKPAYLEVLHIFWHNICPDLLPLDYVPSVLSMSTRRSCPRSLIKSLIRLLGTQGMSRYAFAKNIRRLHDYSSNAV